MSIHLPNRNALPSFPGNRAPSRRERLAPLAYAGGLLAIGAALLVAKPRIGNVPASMLSKDAPKGSRWRRAAQVGRDGASTFAPTNVTDSIGRSLMIGGAALVIARLLDEAVGKR
ncbi:hypothetical protein KO516_13030 [Citreicella sp. C3M06]|uniref:hypothetical protein n=1 Tax=Roseobacteraceae TaxID=2854170 RepID=UPI001C09DF69|nr:MULTISPECIES: hypothetical protein [Roseobacteraceae]MBU2961720.1 hypothetical protein [Citreicella sp. C3M06]MDO6583992.1 hypothetical protein [Salipiger sp. 1_MG-2023]